MTHLLTLVGVRFVVFGAALGLIAWKRKHLTVKPAAALSVVALVFAVLNLSLYWMLAGVVKLASLWTLGLLAPFVANLALLVLTTSAMKRVKVQVKADGIYALVETSAILAGLSLVLRLAGV